MKYTTLKNDIVNILHSENYNLHLKLYDENGNTTLNPQDTQWCYIVDDNIMLKFMEKDNPNLLIIKDKKNTDKNFQNVIEQLRKICTLNGISINIKTYDNLNQVKLYNFLKSDIDNRQDKMNENVDYNNLVNSFTNMIKIANSTKRNSDLYLSESLNKVKSQKLLKEMLEEISSLHSLKNLNLKETFSQIMLAKNASDIKTILENTENDVKTKMSFETDNINNITSYVKNEYLNNIDFKSDKPKTMFVLENVKVYPIKESYNKENLVLAYNELMKHNDSIKSDIDLLKIIKDNKICESFNVYKKDLLNLYLLNDNKVIQPKYAYVIESADGEKAIINSSLVKGLKSFAHYLNKGGLVNDDFYKKIISETIKYNNIVSFLKEYSDRYSLKDVNVKLYKMLKETNSRLENNDYLIEESIDYSEEYSELVKKLNIEHPALKYIALENARENQKYSKIIIESKMNDINSLTSGILPYAKNIDLTQKIVENIINKSYNVKGLGSDDLDNAKKIYESFCFENDDAKQIISSSLYNYMNTNKKFIKSKTKKFVQTLSNYLK